MFPSLQTAGIIGHAWLAAPPLAPRISDWVSHSPGWRRLISEHLTARLQLSSVGITAVIPRSSTLSSLPPPLPSFLSLIHILFPSTSLSLSPSLPPELSWALQSSRRTENKQGIACHLVALQRSDNRAGEGAGRLRRSQRLPGRNSQTARGDIQVGRMPCGSPGKPVRRGAEGRSKSPRQEPACKQRLLLGGGGHCLGMEANEVAAEACRSPQGHWFFFRHPEPGGQLVEPQRWLPQVLTSLSSG